jgi:predicted RNA-binding protein associated with RNAse of E/G family
MNGKGSTRRPCQTHPDEYDLRHAFAFGLIPKEQFEEAYQNLLKQHKIVRSGKVIHGRQDL